MNEKSANQVNGFLLRSSDNSYFFRVYGEADQNGKKSFTDYDIAAYDIEVTINDQFVSLYENDNKNRLDYSQVTLGKGYFYPYNISFNKYHEERMTLGEAIKFIKERNLCKGDKWELRSEKEYQAGKE